MSIKRKLVSLLVAMSMMLAMVGLGQSVSQPVADAQTSGSWQCVPRPINPWSTGVSCTRWVCSPNGWASWQGQTCWVEHSNYPGGI